MKSHSDPACSGGRANRDCSPAAHSAGRLGGGGGWQEGRWTPRGVTAPVEGKALKGVELQERSGMKQGRAGCRGASRRGGVKPRGRNVPGRQLPGARIEQSKPQWTRHAGQCCRSQKPHERRRAACQKQCAAAWRRSYSVGGATPRMDCMGCSGNPTLRHVREDLVALCRCSTEHRTHPVRGGIAKPIGRYRHTENHRGRT